MSSSSISNGPASDEDIDKIRLMLARLDSIKDFKSVKNIKDLENQLKEKKVKRWADYFKEKYISSLDESNVFNYTEENDSWLKTKFVGPYEKYLPIMYNRLHWKSDNLKEFSKELKRKISQYNVTDDSIDIKFIDNKNIIDFINIPAIPEKSSEKYITYYAQKLYLDKKIKIDDINISLYHLIWIKNKSKVSPCSVNIYADLQRYYDVVDDEEYYQYSIENERNERPIFENTSLVKIEEDKILSKFDDIEFIEEYFQPGYCVICDNEAKFTPEIICNSLNPEQQIYIKNHYYPDGPIIFLGWEPRNIKQIHDQKRQKHELRNTLFSVENLVPIQKMKFKDNKFDGIFPKAISSVVREYITNPLSSYTIYISFENNVGKLEKTIIYVDKVKFNNFNIEFKYNKDTITLDYDMYGYEYEGGWFIEGKKTENLKTADKPTPMKEAYEMLQILINGNNFRHLVRIHNREPTLLTFFKENISILRLQYSKQFELDKFLKTNFFNEDYNLFIDVDTDIISYFWKDNWQCTIGTLWDESNTNKNSCNTPIYPHIYPLSSNRKDVSKYVWFGTDYERATIRYTQGKIVNFYFDQNQNLINKQRFINEQTHLGIKTLMTAELDGNLSALDALNIKRSGDAFQVFLAAKSEIENKFLLTSDSLMFIQCQLLKIPAIFVNIPQKKEKKEDVYAIDIYKPSMTKDTCPILQHNEEKEEGRISKENTPPIKDALISSQSVSDSDEDQYENQQRCGEIPSSFVTKKLLQIRSSHGGNARVTDFKVGGNTKLKLEILDFKISSLLQITEWIYYNNKLVETIRETQNSIENEEDKEDKNIHLIQELGIRDYLKLVIDLNTLILHKDAVLLFDLNKPKEIANSVETILNLMEIYDLNFWEIEYCENDTREEFIVKLMIEGIFDNLNKPISDEETNQGMSKLTKFTKKGKYEFQKHVLETDERIESFINNPLQFIKSYQNYKLVTQKQLLDALQTQGLNRRNALDPKSEKSTIPKGIKVGGNSSYPHFKKNTRYMLFVKNVMKKRFKNLTNKSKNNSNKKQIKKLIDI